MTTEDARPVPATDPTPSRLLRRAQQLAGFTVAYNLVEGAVAVGADRPGTSVRRPCPHALSLVVMPVLATHKRGVADAR